MNPVRKRIFWALGLTVAVVGAFAVACIKLNAWLEEEFSNAYKVPCALELFECDKREAVFSLRVPTPITHFVLGVSSGYDSEGRTIEWAGSIEILESSGPKGTVKFDWRSSQSCNWLQNAGASQAGRILTWEGWNSFVEPLRRREKVRFKLTFDKLPAPGSNLWLCWCDPLVSREGNLSDSEYIDLQVEDQAE